MSVRHFARTPKGLLIVLFAPLLAVAVASTGAALVGPLVLASALAAMAVDLPILRWRKGRWTFPDGALLTGLFVAMVLAPYEPWYVGALSSAIGVASKYLVRARHANTFNPAALALVVAYYAFGSAQGWWGALPDAHPAWLVLLVGTGVVICDRLNKLPVVVAFLGAYYLLATLSAYLGETSRVAELFRSPDLHAALYFALFMVSDPPTSPPKPRQQLWFGALTGFTTWACFTWIGAVWWLPGGLLVANAWESVRRVREHAARHAQA
jgi:Na+-translocating ferredoxin:NAD+ oxidoreductase RnfD subunit